MSKLGLRLLGDFVATDRLGRPLTISAKKARALMAIVALAPGVSVPRERLASLLWSDRGEPQARSSLRQTLTVLRKEIGEDGEPLLGGSDERVEFAAGTVTSDAQSFCRLALSNDRDTLREAVALWQGELLADLMIADPSFEDWVAVERNRFRDLMIATLERLISLEAPDGRAGLAKRLVALDPLREASHLTLMRALAEAGDRAQALQHYAACRDLLKQELGISPGAEIEALRQKLQDSVRKEPAAAPASPLLAASGHRPSIAVPPFVNLSGDPGQQYLSDGITEDIIVQLSRFSELRVITRISAARIAADIDPVEGARALGVNYMVRGNIRRSGERLIVSCQLIDGATGDLLWGERYDRTTADMFSVQDDVVARIVTTLDGRLISLGASSVRRKPTENWTAYDYFLRGRDLCNLGKEDVSEPFFSRAVELDPGFTLAHAWRGIGLLGKFWISADTSDLDRGLASAMRALELDPNEAMAHHATGVVLHFAAKFDRSASHLRRAMELNPLEVNIRADYANLLLHTGQMTESLAAIDEALARDSYPPPWIHYVRGKILFFLGRYREAIATLDNGMVYTYRAHGLLAAAHAHMGQRDDARRHIEQMKAANPGVGVKHFVASLPFADPRRLDGLLSGLQLAGFGNGTAQR